MNKAYFDEQNFDIGVRLAGKTSEVLTLVILVRPWLDHF